MQQHQQTQAQPLLQQAPNPQHFQIPQLQQDASQLPVQQPQPPQQQGQPQQQQQQQQQAQPPPRMLQPHQQQPPHLNFAQLQSTGGPQQVVIIAKEPTVTPHQKNPGYSRKDKSLGLLCDNFLATYMHLVPGQGDVCLDEAATRLEVERRRIYDIVNVLESVDVVTRRQKNCYTWNGLDNLGATMQRLASAVSPTAPSPSRSVTTEVTEQTGGDSMSWAPGSSNLSAVNSVGNMSGQQAGSDADSPPRTTVRYARKDKSLSILSQRFIQMFLNATTPIIGLDDAAAALLGGGDVSDAKLKTKVRRLYDIANVLSSLRLLEKTQLPDTRKPAFKWRGAPGPGDIAEHLRNTGAGPGRQSEGGGNSEGSFASESPASKREPDLANGHRGGKRMRAQGRASAGRGLPLSRGAQGSGSYSPPETPGISGLATGLAAGAMTAPMSPANAPEQLRQSMMQVFARSMTPASGGAQDSAAPQHSVADSHTGPQPLAMAASAAGIQLPSLPPFLPLPPGFPPTGLAGMPMPPMLPGLPPGMLPPFPMSFPMAAAGMPAMQQLPGFPAGGTPNSGLLNQMPPLPTGATATDSAIAAQVWGAYMQFYQTWLAWQQQHPSQPPQHQQQSSMAAAHQPVNAPRAADGQQLNVQQVQQEPQQQQIQRPNSQPLQLPQQHTAQFAAMLQGSQQFQQQQQPSGQMATSSQQLASLSMGSAGPSTAQHAALTHRHALGSSSADTAMADAEGVANGVAGQSMTQMLQGVSAAVLPQRQVMANSGALAAAVSLLARRSSGSGAVGDAPDQLPMGVLPLPASHPGAPAPATTTCQPMGQ